MKNNDLNLLRGHVESLAESLNIATKYSDRQHTDIIIIASLEIMEKDIEVMRDLLSSEE